VDVNGQDNHAALDRIGWQVHVYGAAGEELRAWCRQADIALHVFAWDSAHERAGLARDAAYLLRPDTYVALADSSAAPAALARYLQERLWRRAPVPGAAA
jgi:hypothetical protein